MSEIHEIPSSHLNPSSPNSPRVIVALDVSSLDECLNLAKQLSPKLCRLKVGKELFTACGPIIVEKIQSLGFDVFLDLKFHDIPVTVAKAVSVAADLGVWMVNVHASGGEAMLKASADVLAHRTVKPKLIAVTVLTSMSEQDVKSLGFSRTLAEQVSYLADLSWQCGLDGVVCSAQEAKLLKDNVHSDLTTVTPGIRPAWAANNDQHRVLTPEQAVAAGSDYLVIGRPITQSEDPLLACEKIAQSIEGVH